jgi:hypothetical protein
MYYSIVLVFVLTVNVVMLLSAVSSQQLATRALYHQYKVARESVFSGSFDDISLNRILRYKTSRQIQYDGVLTF